SGFCCAVAVIAQASATKAAMRVYLGIGGLATNDENATWINPGGRPSAKRRPDMTCGSSSHRCSAQTSDEEQRRVGGDERPDENVETHERRVPRVEDDTDGEQRQRCGSWQQENEWERELEPDHRPGDDLAAERARGQPRGQLREPVCL